MAPPVRKALNRLARTSWDELRTRLSQEFAKRADYALYRANLLPDPDVAAGSSCAANFFFRPDQLQDRVALLKQHVPAVVEDTIQEADQILQHQFRLLGYRDLDYGTEINWHLDAVHGKHTPLKPWYRIRFLDFDEAGDHKVTWELNRHQHLVTLAKAWTFTGEPRYANEIAKQFSAWHTANPYPMGINWGSSLEVAFRSLSWLWVRSLLAQAPNLPNSFHQDVLRALARNGKYIERFLSTYFSPNTHLIGEAVALFFIGTLCPEIPAARRWKEQGLAIVLGEAERQVRPDGVYFEQSLYYHVYALDFFLHTRVLAACNNITLPESFDGVLRRMLEVVRVLSSNGEPQAFGDDDGGRLFNPRRDRAEHMSDPLALGAALYSEPSLCDSAALTEEAIWIFGENAVGRLSSKSERKVTESVAFPDGGLYVIATGSSQMLIDAGPHGWGSGGHGHADALSVRLSIEGRHWLVDPGSYVYIASNEEPNWRDRFRGTAAHNTLRVDGLDQASPRSPFSWTSLPDVCTHEWQTTPQYDFFEGAHQGYMRLPHPVLHGRKVFHLRDEYWLVLDTASGKGVHDLEIFWHFAPELQVSEFEGGLTAGHPNGGSLLLFSIGNKPWAAATEQGYISPAYGEKQPATVGIFRSSRVSVPTEHATLLLPSKAGEEPGSFRYLGAVDTASAYSFERDDITDTIVFAAEGPAWEFGAFRSHAPFFFVRMTAGEVELIIMKRAAFAEWNGQPFFESQDNIRIPWLHWSKSEGATASDPKLLKFFDPEVLRAKTPVPLKQ